MKSSDLKAREAEIEALVIQVQEGHQEAFAKLYDIFVDPIYRYVFYRVHSADTEDLVENVFLKVWQHIQHYKNGKGSFSAWVFRIAHNLVVDYYRVSKDRETESLDVSVPDTNREHNPLRMTEGRLDQRIVRKALKKLKKNYREILIHKFINDLSNAEVAEIIGKPEGSVRILQHRALKALRKELEAEGISYDV